MQTPSIARAIIALVDPATNNGEDVAPATITRVWSPSGTEDRPRWTINYRVTGDNADVPKWVTSGYLYDNEADARAAHPDDGGRGIAAFWPARV